LSGEAAEIRFTSSRGGCILPVLSKQLQHMGTVGVTDETVKPADLAASWGGVRLRDTTRGRKRFVLRQNIYGMIRAALEVGEFPVWWTCTAPGVFDIEDFKRRWKKLVLRMKRRWSGVNGYGVCARQPKSGQWHAHIVVDRFLPIAELREMCLACGFGTFQNLKQVGNREWIPSENRHCWVLSLDAASRFARYMASYCEGGHNCIGKLEDVGSRRVMTFGHARTCSNRFKWCRGRAAMMARGCHYMRVKYNKNVFAWYQTPLERAHLMWLGWETLSERTRHFMLHGDADNWPDAGVRAWWMKWFHEEDERFPF